MIESNLTSSGYEDATNSSNSNSSSRMSLDFEVVFTDNFISTNDSGMDIIMQRNILGCWAA